MATGRVIAYIDGHNLYHGMREAGLLTSRWLDLRAMCETLLKPDQQLELARSRHGLRHDLLHHPRLRRPGRAPAFSSFGRGI